MGSFLNDAEKCDQVMINGKGEPCSIKDFGGGVYLIREGSSTEVHVVIFRIKDRCMPVTLKLHEVPFGRNELKEIFTRLLGFDGNRLNNRGRNTAITIIRNMLPDVVRGTIPDSTLRYYLHKNQLTILDESGVKTRLHYSTFSRNIKDTLK